MSEAIACLRRVAFALAAGVLPAPADCTAHANGLNQFLDGASETIEEALGVSCTARTRHRRARRDELLREYRLKFCPGISLEAAGQRISREINRYRATSWQTDRSRSCPATGSPTRALIQEILTVWDVAISPRNARRILAISRCSDGQLNARERGDD